MVDGLVEGVVEVAPAKRRRFTKQQVKLRQRLNLSMQYWMRSGKWVYWLTLTSSPDSVDEKKSLQSSWKKLIQQWRREYCDELEFCAIETDEGFGVIHAFVVTAERTPRIFDWLKGKWSIYHLAGRVRINELSGKTVEDCEKVSWYAVSQYASNQGTHFVKARWSRFTFLPHPAMEYIRMCRVMLRREVFWVTPWHATWKLIDEFALAMVLGKQYCLNGYVFVFGVFGEIEVFDRPSIPVAESYDWSLGSPLKIP